MKKLIIVLIAALCLSVSAFAAQAVEVSTWDELFAEVEKNDVLDITITADLVATKGLYLDGKSGSIDGGGHVLTRDEKYLEAIVFYSNDPKPFTIKNVILDGEKDKREQGVTHPLLFAGNCELTLEDVIVRNNKRIYNGGGGIDAYGEKCDLTLKGKCAITGNESFNVEEGVGSGGGILANNGAKVTIGKDVDISGNYAVDGAAVMSQFYSNVVFQDGFVMGKENRINPAFPEGAVVSAMDRGCITLGDNVRILSDNEQINSVMLHSSSFIKTLPSYKSSKTSIKLSQDYMSTDPDGTFTLVEGTNLSVDMFKDIKTELQIEGAKIDTSMSVSDDGTKISVSFKYIAETWNGLTALAEVFKKEPATILLEKDIQATGAYKPESGCAAIIDGQGHTVTRAVAGDIITIAENEDGDTYNLTLKNITLDGANGEGLKGRAVNVGKNANLTLNKAVIKGHEAEQDGAGIALSDKNATLNVTGESSVTGNKSAGNGGGVYTAGTIKLSSGLNVTGNKAATGGGMYMVDEAQLSINAKLFVSDNTNADSKVSNIYYGNGAFMTIIDAANMKGSEINLSTIHHEHDIFIARCSKSGDDEVVLDEKYIRYDGEIYDGSDMSFVFEGPSAAMDQIIFSRSNFKAKTFAGICMGALLKVDDMALNNDITVNADSNTARFLLDTRINGTNEMYSIKGDMGDNPLFAITSETSLILDNISGIESIIEVDNSGLTLSGKTSGIAQIRLLNGGMVHTTGFEAPDDPDTVVATLVPDKYQAGLRVISEATGKDMAYFRIRDDEKGGKWTIDKSGCLWPLDVPEPAKPYVKHADGTVTEYDTISLALSAARTGEKVLVPTDIVHTGGITIPEGVELITSGHMSTSADNAGALTISEGATFTTRDSENVYISSASNEAGEKGSYFNALDISGTYSNGGNLILKDAKSTGNGMLAMLSSGSIELDGESQIGKVKLNENYIILGEAFTASDTAATLYIGKDDYSENQIVLFFKGSDQGKFAKYFKLGDAPSDKWYINEDGMLATKTPAPVENTLLLDKLILGKGKKIAAKNILPFAFTGSVTWTSGDEKVLKIAGKGKNVKLSALTPGETTLTAKFGGETVQTIPVTVVAKKLGVASVSATNSITLKLGSSKTLSPKVKPATASDKTLKWFTTDKSVATVDDSGEIKATGKGKCKVYAIAASGVRKVINVTVKNAAKESVQRVDRIINLF
ncbi:MAG: Ig-like domain-containing protein [Clostridia bacterium]|nr:Ig-like domain-containing protein [Clostridia bacterium]